MKKHITPFIALPLCFAVFMLVIIFENKKLAEFHFLGIEDELKPVRIDENIKGSAGRGAIKINDTLSVRSSLILVENKSNFDGWLNHRPIVDGDNQPYVYQLWDVPIPYVIYKKPNNDTLIAIKNNDTLKFIITKTEADSMDTLTFGDLFDDFFQQKNEL